MDNSCLEMKDDPFIMKIQYKVTENIIAKSFGGTMSDSLAHGLLEMANGHYIRGIRAMLKK